MNKDIRINIDHLVLSLLLIFSTIFQRLTVTAAGQQIPLVFFVGLFCVILMFMFKNLDISLGRTVMFISFLTITIFSLLFFDQYSVTSLLYLVMIYIPFLFIFYFTEETKVKYLKQFQNIVLITAIFGIFQFTVQLIGVPFLDPWAFLPAEFLQAGYNTTYELSYGAGVMKPNGGIFLEPSLFSQFLAISIIIEMVYFKRWTRVFIQLIALVMSFSGTGLLILIVFSIPLLFKLKPRYIFTILVLASIVGYFFLSSDYSKYTVSRATEFNSESSSMSVRFINPVKVIINEPANEFLFGHGPGESERDVFWLETNFSVIPKLWYEYGLFSMILFMAFLSMAVFYKNQNFISASVFFMYLFLSGSLLQPQTVFLLYFLTIICNVNSKKIITKEKSKRKFIITKNFELKVKKTIKYPI